MLTQTEKDVLFMARMDGRRRLLNIVTEAHHFVINNWETRHVPHHRKLIREALRCAKSAQNLLK